MKKIMTLVIGVSLLFPSGAVFAKERHGVQLEITKTDGTKINGELVAVKQDSTLLLPVGSIDVSAVKIIKIVKGSNAGTGFLLGLLAGGAVGAAIGALSYSEGNGNYIIGGKGLSAEAGGIIGGLAGGLIGRGIGSSIYSYHEIIQIEGKSPEEIKKVLEKLRTQARFPEYQ